MLPLLAGTALAIFALGMVLRRLRQPHVVVYILVGALLGPHALGLFLDETLVSQLGVLGVDLLLFFVGMEISPRRLLAHWRVAILGTILQVGVSVGCIWVLGLWYAWPPERSVLLGFVISLSSTAVVLKMLEDWRETETPVGQAALGILLAQDLALVPMVIVIGLLRGGGVDVKTASLQVAGGAVILALVVWMSLRDEIRLPLGRWLRADHEFQVFGAVVVCLGVASLTGALGLSTALGAFVGGMIIGLARETDWVHRSLHPFRVVFVALFFVHIGMLVDVRFLVAEWRQIALMVTAVFVTNTVINAAIFRLFGNGWRASLYGGALLAQIGEFSFVLAAVGRQAGIISAFAYNATIIVIALSLLLSPAWIGVLERLGFAPRRWKVSADDRPNG